MKNFFYCYSFKMKDYLKSKGLVYINKSLNENTQKPYFLFEKSLELDKAISEWNMYKK